MFPQELGTLPWQQEKEWSGARRKDVSWDRRKDMRKKILAVIAIVISALILIGCGTEDMEMTGDYLKLLARESKSERHELIEECMDFYNVCGTKELNEKQVVDFCRMKGLLQVDVISKKCQGSSMEI